MKRTVSALFALFALDGCALVPQGGIGDTPVPDECREVPPAPAADGRAAAMVRIARAEWHAWGDRVAELQPGRQVLILPDGKATGWEEERPAFAALARYWCVTPPRRNHWALAAQAAGFPNVETAAGTIDKTAFERTPIGLSPFNEPWSAAFVSWVVWQAGVAEDRFRYSDTHWDYVADAITAAPGSRSFTARGIADTVPRPGDLACATRSGQPPADWHDLATEGSRPMHCDIVVGTAPCAFAASGRCVEAIGGNVLQGVTLTRAPLDAAGHLLTGPEVSRDWIVILAGD
ncbi:DUF2272 domain-containing protein [Zavarzinia sp.]|uniref:DUF2272 domain-containing protein n=1 Tax=Zavarzinia sp. TaxID=2027920 RepID=UPI0035682F90